MADMSFIVYKRNERNYQELIHNLSKLPMPNGITAEYITVTGEGGYGEAYNAGMRKSMAKYMSMKMPV